MYNINESHRILNNAGLLNEGMTPEELKDKFFSNISKTYDIHNLKQKVEAGVDAKGNRGKFNTHVFQLNIKDAKSLYGILTKNNNTTIFRKYSLQGKDNGAVFVMYGKFFLRIKGMSEKQIAKKEEFKTYPWKVKIFVGESRQGKL